MAETLRPELCVIGGGSAGRSAATAAVALGPSVVLIEKRKLGAECLGGDCLLSQALRAAASRAALARSARPVGVTAEVVDFSKVREHVQGVIASQAPAASSARLAALGVRVIGGEAKFKDRRTVEAGETQIRARRFIVATGAGAVLPPIPGLETGPYLTGDSILDLRSLPGHLIVIGAGHSGLELAQAFRRLGSAVTVLEAAQPLADEDPECAAIVLDQLEREGVVIRSGVNIASVSYAGGRVAVTIDGDNEPIEGTHLLLAAGRQPSFDGLALDRARVRHDKAGIRVNRTLRTSNRRIYAIGDAAAGQPRSTHAGHYQAGVAVRNALFRQRLRVEYDAIPRVTYTDPELAQVGLTEAQLRKQARKRRIAIRILRWSYNDNDRAQAERAVRGHIKVITDTKGAILGVTIVGAQAGELIGIWALAMAQKLNIRAMADLVLPHPTLSEIGKHAAIDFFTPSLTPSMLRRIIVWLRSFG
jgi:pyruvate/2-oxoglutarate dehydrogenase complex dihydrolipoamide dehydrogenase (E3) component